MAETKDSMAEKGNENAAAGQKHETDHENPDAKRSKTERRAKIDESPEDSTASEEDSGDEGKSEKLTDDQDVKGESAVQPGEETEVPSNILEKGIIYFFIRGRVNIEKPESVNDIRRSYIILRPIAKDAKLGKGPIGDAGNTRLLALPKKVLPSTGRDRFMAFVEKSGASYDELKGRFLAGEDYETKTAGTRHTPAATPVGEGVYAMTTTGRESHLTYMLTLPEELDEVQDKLGLKEKGSFILSTKNPKYPGPSYARLPKNPDYPKKVLDTFRDLRWIPSQPEHLNYANAQLLMIGESSGIKKAVEPQKEDKKEGKEEPIETLEKLEEEDLERMRDLPGGSRPRFSQICKPTQTTTPSFKQLFKEVEGGIV
ncbi:hypothetical protein PT974_03891 [Cladobotryum mycophilum]|uniref:BTB domain transcription factor n=1 Tax=Cladobotryum mycophilum TaxID=491253 RepID=A0ABR0STK1_9HYPO